MNDKTGGPAFPAEIDLEYYNMPSKRHEQGMSLRDYFAAKAMAALCCGLNSANEAQKWTPANFADKAYKMADAMITERAKVPA